MKNTYNKPYNRFLNRLEKLDDVEISSNSDREGLIFDNDNEVWINGYSNTLKDKDGDTILYLEKSDDEDIIRMNIDGSEIGVFQTTGINFTTDLTAVRVYNPVYNDVADFYDTDEPVIYGKVYKIKENGMVGIVNKDREKGVIGICSDTYGFGLGKRKDNQVPISIGGIVLSYIEDIDKIKVGDVLTNNKVGNLRKMRWWEKILFPERIVGIFFKKETRTLWNGIEVNRRHWVKIK